ncbi:putative ammonium transporter 3 [Mya arenaria]|uniref:putative ammonium transporter 3 n=1 Tax=Mya arenaria TaxID=6604 RepID=UPI0022E4C441|nr:putative ammonium transporter 3 [Mya arenaria]
MADPQSDAIWILSSTFIVFTMQSGFGLLESGTVSVKNELNIMVKNAVDVVFGGLTYWIFGYGLSFGNASFSNAFIGWGDFFVTAEDEKLGIVYSKFFFQASFATTATTIVSGAMAERTKLVSYMIFSMINTVLFSIPAHWVWSSKGWLYMLGVVDIAGAGPVHIVGGVTGLVATLMLKPRHGRYDGERHKASTMSSPTNAVLGMFMLWWGWLGFNCGSTFGISGSKWKLAARSAATTLCSSVAGGVGGFVLSYIVKDRKFDVTYMINGLLGSLVSVTGVCAIVQPWEGLIIGFVGSLLSNAGVALLDKLKIDDPVGCVGTHAVSGTWGMLVAGLFIRKDQLLNALYLHKASTGLFYGGGLYQLGIQSLAVVTIIIWTVVVSFICLKLIDVTLGLRVSLEEEIIGADIIEHGIGNFVYDRKTKTLSYAPEFAEPIRNGQVSGETQDAIEQNTADNNHIEVNPDTRATG